MTRRFDPLASVFSRASLAHIVLAVVTGLPLRSASALLPQPDDERGPFLGV